MTTKPMKLAGIIHKNCPMLDSEDEEIMRLDILQLFKEIVPDKAPEDYDEGNEGWNNFRSEILKRMEEL